MKHKTKEIKNKKVITILMTKSIATKIQIIKAVLIHLRRAKFQIE